VILRGDCIEVMAELPEASVDAIVTDPPYGLGFMGKRWDALPPGEDVAREALRVLKPGGHLLAFGGTRTYHRLACAVEDAGFEIRDTICWLYGSGFPKSLDVSKAIDKAAGAEREVVGEKVAPKGKTHAELHGARSGRAGGGIMGDAVPVARNSELVTAPATAEAAEWDGWGTALKPAHEPVVVARKPLVGTVAANVAEHGTGALNIDGCRIEADWSERSEAWKRSGRSAKPDADKIAAPPGIGIDTSKGRWPANVVLDEEAAGMLDEQTGDRPSGSGAKSRTPGRAARCARSMASQPAAIRAARRASSTSPRRAGASATRGWTASRSARRATSRTTPTSGRRTARATRAPPRSRSATTTRPSSPLRSCAGSSGSSPRPAAPCSTRSSGAARPAAPRRSKASSSSASSASPSTPSWPKRASPTGPNERSPSLPADSYTPGEVSWLLSMNGEEAEDGDWISGEEQARARDVHSLRSTGQWGAGDESGLPVIARWHDVRRARDEVIERRAGRAVAQLSRGGFTQQQIAERAGVHQATVSRKLKVRRDDLLAELHDPDAEEDDQSPRRTWSTLCAACYMGEGNVRLSKAPKVQTPAVRLGATVAERWVLAGRMWDASRGRPVQRWHTRHGDQLLARPISRAALGAAYDAVFVLGDEQRVERLNFIRRSDADIPTGNPHIGQWKRATAAADRGEPPPQMVVLPRVALPIVDAEPERQTHCCEQHLAPELRSRIVRGQWFTARPVMQAVQILQAERESALQSGAARRDGAEWSG
jgi:hypothetical protein